MTSNDLTRPTDDAFETRTGRAGASPSPGRGAPSEVGSGRSEALHASSTKTPDDVEDVMEETTGVGPQGAASQVAGTAGGAMGASASAAGAASMGSGEARGGMAATEPDVEGNDTTDGAAAMRTAPGTAVTGGGPMSGGQAGSGPDDPAV